MNLLTFLKVGASTSIWQYPLWVPLQHICGVFPNLTPLDLGCNQLAKGYSGRDGKPLQPLSSQHTNGVHSRDRLISNLYEDAHPTLGVASYSIGISHFCFDRSFRSRTSTLSDRYGSSFIFFNSVDHHFASHRNHSRYNLQCDRPWESEERRSPQKTSFDPRSLHL